MYLTCPAMHTIKLPPGRSSTTLIFRGWYSRSDLPLFDFYAHISDGCKRERGRGEFAHQGGCGILRWVDRTWTALLGALEFDWHMYGAVNSYIEQSVWDNAAGD